MNNILDNPQINVEYVKPTGIFTNYIFKAIPLAFDESMSYYETLSGLLYYLKNTILPTVNNNAAALIELQKLYTMLHDFVDNYFKNLDVQEEINNKLDQMVEDGTFENILANYSNITRVYNTHQDLINDANALVNNMKVKTLGYYEINDGGGAEYYITDTLDETKYQEKVNGLYAELVYNNDTNVRQFGAYGDGIHDDTQSIKKMYSLLTKFLLDDKYNYSFKARINAGKYLVSETIEIPIYIKTEIIGNAVILSSVENDATLRFTDNNEISQTGMRYKSTQSYVDGNVISSSNGVLVLQRTNDIEDIQNNNNSIGIQIGSPSGKTGNINISRCNFSNIVINGFKKGIEIIQINTYLLTFNSVRPEYNKYGIYINGNDNINSGENISFNNCVIAHSYNGLYLDGVLAELNFNECSFDFNGNHILENKATNNLINFTGCHFEGVGLNEPNVPSDSDNTVGYGYIVYRNVDDYYSQPTFTFNSCFIHLNTGNPYNFIFGNLCKPFNSQKSLKIVLNNPVLSYTNTKLKFNNRYFADENTEIIGSLYQTPSETIPYMYSNDDIIGKFEIIPDELNIDYTTNPDEIKQYGYTIGANTWSSLNVNVNIDKKDKIFTKSLNITQLGLNNYCSLRRKINNIKGKVTVTSYAKLGNDIVLNNEETNYRLNLSNTFNFYDEKNNKIKELPVTPSISNQYMSDDNWVCITQSVNVPIGTDYCSVTLNTTLRDDENNSLTFKGTVKFGGIIINELT